MILGNVAALLQTNVKRMLAYSSIANAGYALLGVLGLPRPSGASGESSIYLLAYTFMNFGAFTLVILLESKGYAGESVSDFNGLAQRNMPAAVVMLLFLLSLAGIPPTAGLHRQVLPVHGGHEGRLRLARRPRGRHVGGLALLLLPDRRRDVLHGGRGAKLQSSYALTAVVVDLRGGDDRRSASRRSRSSRS